MKHLAQLAAAVSLTAAAALAVDTSLRDQLLAIPLTADLGGDTSRPVASRDAFSFMAANSPRERQRPFSFGNRLFNTNWIEAPASTKSFDGLGPLFNRVSCSGCHTKDGRAAAPVSGQCPSDGFLMRISVPGTGMHGEPKPHPVYGDQISERSIGKVAPEACVKVNYTEMPGKYGDGSDFSLRAPTYQIEQLGYGPLGSLLTSPRVAPPVFGLGLLEVVPASTLEALADPDDKDADGISGRMNIVFDHVSGSLQPGRFGWKANQPNLLQQNASAAIGDIGLTTQLFAKQNCTASQTACNTAIAGGEPEISDEFLQKLTLYTSTLAVPAQRGTEDNQVQKGEALFRSMQCSACHMPTLLTGSQTRFPELANQTFHPFSDLLLHDMGKELADGRPDFGATGQEWRTPPLWGIGLLPTVNGHQDLLHDGRARGVAEAILWHGGEANEARERFKKAEKVDRDALVAFVNSL
jgi:CxxC motif-containing protein (DUF1111 family)